MHKIYTDIIKNFFEKYCSINDIITLEQAGDCKNNINISIVQIK